LELAFVATNKQHVQLVRSVIRVNVSQLTVDGYLLPTKNTEQISQARKARINHAKIFSIVGQGKILEAK
jgi:hypothetical protein